MPTYLMSYQYNIGVYSRFAQLGLCTLCYVMNIFVSFALKKFKLASPSEIGGLHNDKIGSNHEVFIAWVPWPSVATNIIQVSSKI